MPTSPTSPTALEKLDALRTLPADWDGCGAPAPDGGSIDRAKLYLTKLVGGWATANLSPAPVYVSPGLEGEVIIEHEGDGLSHMLVFYPCGLSVWGFKPVATVPVNQPVNPPTPPVNPPVITTKDDHHAR